MLYRIKAMLDVFIGRFSKKEYEVVLASYCTSSWQELIKEDVSPLYDRSTLPLVVAKVIHGWLRPIWTAINAISSRCPFHGFLILLLRLAEYF